MIIDNIPYYLASGILGIMLFFSFIVAPITFKVLDENASRKFIRKIFPYYYLTNLALSLTCVICFYLIQQITTDFFLILVISLLFIISNFILMPLINKFRDSNQEKKFKYSHALSVLINFLQLFILIYVLF